MCCQERAEVLQRRLQQPRAPVQLAADVVEKVILTGGEPYLDTRESSLHWTQLALLDVYGVLAVGGLLAVCAAVAILRLALLAMRAGLRRLHANGSHKAKTV